MDFVNAVKYYMLRNLCIFIVESWVLVEISTGDGAGYVRTCCINHKLSSSVAYCRSFAILFVQSATERW